MSRLKEELSSFPSTASTSQEVHESNSESTSSRKLRVTLLSSEWRSTKGGLSTINRELAVQLAKHPSVEVSVYLPQCSEEDKRVAASHNVQLIEAEEMPGYDPVDWLSFLPENHSVDCVIGHGAVLGRQVQGIRRQCKCKWIQVVHTAPEELGMYKSYADAISKGEKKHQDEVKLCEKADQVVAVGPKLAEAFSGYLRACGKDQDVLNLTPGILSEFSDVKQATEERKTFNVLVFGRGDNEDFQLKGYDIAALAIAQLKDEPEPYKLLFVGAPSGKEENVKDLLLEQGIDRSQLTVRCFSESREQLARLFCEVDLAIMPSRTEGFGLAALEALSAGLPVLVSGNSGLGEALQEVPFGPYCVVESEDPKDWANAIRGARKKKRKFRLDESKILCETYAKVYNWQDHCNRLVEIMCNISRGNRASNEQDSSMTATVDCHTGEKPSCSEKLPQKGSSVGVQPVKKGKRPLPPSGDPDTKHPRLSKDEGESCPTAPVDCRKECFSDNQCVAEEEQAHGHSVLSAEKLDIQIDCDAREQGASPTQNVNLEENVATKIYPTTQQVMNLIAAESFKTINPSNPDELNGFHRYLRDTRQLLIVDNKMGSLIITVRCSSLRILDELWEDYRTGHLKEVAQRYLVTEDILKQLGLDSVQLTLTISEEEYIAYRKNFLKNEGIVEPVANTSLPDDLPLDAIKTEDEQTLPTDAAPSEFSQDLSPPCKASTPQEGQGNSSSSPSSKELRAVSLKGSKEGKRPLTSGSTLASKSPKTLGGEGIVEVVAGASLLEDLPSVLDLDTIKTEGEQTLPTDVALSKFSEDLSPPCTTSTSQQGQRNSNKLRITLLSSEWRSTKAGLSTINRELAIQLAKRPNVEVSVYLPQCSEEDKRVAASHNVHLIEAQKMAGYDNPVDWLSSLPDGHAVDCVIGHGAVLGRQVQIIKRTHPYCKWIQFVHTAPEELGMYKEYEEHISRGEDKHQVEVDLCKLADQVVAIGPKLAEVFSGYLRPFGKDEDVLNLTPGIFSEFAVVQQASQERSSFSVLVFGRGDNEDFQLKGYDIAAQAIAELKDMTYKLVFVETTRGEEEIVAKKLLEQGIHRSQLKVRRFNESREKLANLFCEVDLAITPSRTEGFGLAALEALSAGLPVLVSGNSGLAEALKKVPHGSSCVVESEDPKDWASAIRAVRHKDREMRLGEFDVLRGAYAKKYSWKEQCDKLVERMKVISSEDSSKRLQSLDKGKRPLSPSDTPASKQPRLLRYAGCSGDEQDLSVTTTAVCSVYEKPILVNKPLHKDTENLGVLKMLRAEYERRAKLKPLSWLNTMQLPLKNVYTRLKIISRRKADFQVENDELGMYDIFQALDESEDVKMTLAEGSPGTGKTTFCLKLAYDWARGEMPTNCSFPKFEFVLLLKCRDINGDLMEAIKEQLLPEDIKEETWTKLSDFITDIDNQERILIILDGLDELPEKSRPCVRKLLNRKILPFCYVLATSRHETGIEVRKNCEFDLLLEIKGFTDEDAFQYIRKHFQNIGPEHTSKGESLIVEIKENDLLNALRNNPLNLILLCVVYEDYKGKLPTARTELYQVVVQCLLRRYCAKHSLVAPEENSALEKQFEENILALGEQAWLCLLSERHGFRESELAALEISYKGLVARDIGLLYKEESLRRLKPQHEYFFLHKTFQEYLAAAFIAHRLRGNELKLFEHIRFHELVGKYRQVFLFVSGLLGRDASILFTQIGGELKYWGEWDWVSCIQGIELWEMWNEWEQWEESEVSEKLQLSEEDWNDYRDYRDSCGWEAATFLTDSFSESGYAEKMAETLCFYIPYPPHVEIELCPDGFDQIFHVLEVCKTFSNLQKPVRLTVNIFAQMWKRGLGDCIQSCSQLQTLSIFASNITLNIAKELSTGLSGNTTLSEFTLQVFSSIDCHAAVVIGALLAGRKALRRITFQLESVWGKTLACAIEPALSANTLLKSVDLSVNGSLCDSAVHDLGKLLSNNALASFSLNISGDVQEFVAAVISRGIAQQTALKSLAVSVDGNLCHSGVSALQNSLLENRSLNDLRLTLHGEIPDNWQSVVENLRSVKKGSVNCTFHPDPGNSITCNQMAHFRPTVVKRGLETKQHFTVVLWGELKCDGAEDLCEVLVCVPLTSLTLKVHGKLSYGVANVIKRYIGRQNALSSLTIITWRKLALGTKALLQELSDKNVTVQVKEHGVCKVPKEACNALNVSIDNPASLTQVFSEVKDTRKEKINLRIINDRKVSCNWPRLLGDCLAENTSLTVLDLTVSNYLINSRIGTVLGESLLRSSSLTVLSLTIRNYSNMAEGWECTLVNSLAKMASLTTLSLAIDHRGEVNYRVADLMAVKSLSSLSVVISGSELNYFWAQFLRKCLEECTSLTKLCLTINNYRGDPDDPDYVSRYITKPLDWELDFTHGLASTSSLKELVITINNITGTYSGWAKNLIEGLSMNNSITSLTVIVSDYNFLSYDSWVFPLISCLAKNTSLTTFVLTVNDYSEGEGCLLPLRHFGWEFDDHFSENTSLTELNLTFNIHSRLSKDWLPCFCDVLMVKFPSLRTVRLQVNNRCATSESCLLYDFSELQLRYGSKLSTFELSVTFYGE